MKSSAGQFSETVEGNDMVLHCPDGSRYAIDAFKALGCGFDALPGYGYSQSTSLSFYLLNGEGSDSLFTCTSP